MQQDHRIIDVEFREITSCKAKSGLSLLILVGHVVAVVLAGGAGLGLWSGVTAMTCLVALAGLALLIGLQANSARRISSIFAVSALFGFCGLGLVLADINAYWSLFGVGLAGLSILVLSKIDRREWNYE